MLYIFGAVSFDLPWKLTDIDTQCWKIDITGLDFGDNRIEQKRSDFKLPFEVFCAALILYDRDTVIFAGGQNRSGPISSTFAFSLANASSKELGNLSEAKYGGSLVDCGKN